LDVDGVGVAVDVLEGGREAGLDGAEVLSCGCETKRSEARDGGALERSRRVWSTKAAAAWRRTNWAEALAARHKTSKASLRASGALARLAWTKALFARLRAAATLPLASAALASSRSI
jgi:hypothetical protein